LVGKVKKGGKEKAKKEFKTEAPYKTLRRRHRTKKKKLAGASKRKKTSTGCTVTEKDSTHRKKNGEKKEKNRLALSAAGKSPHREKGTAKPGGGES